MCRLSLFRSCGLAAQSSCLGADGTSSATWFTDFIQPEARKKQSDAGLGRRAAFDFEGKSAVVLPFRRPYADSAVTRTVVSLGRATADLPPQ